MIDNSKIILSGENFPDDEDELTLYTIMENKFTSYQLQELIDNVGQLEFKNLYLNFINDIKTLETKHQTVLCRWLLQKIGDVYGINFFENITFEIQDEINEFYTFIEFLEFNNTEFVVDVIKMFKINPGSINFEMFDSIDEVDKIITLENKFIKLLVGTIDKKTLQKMVNTMYKKNKQNVNLEIQILQLYRQNIDNLYI